MSFCKRAADGQPTGPKRSRSPSRAIDTLLGFAGVDAVAGVAAHLRGAAGWRGHLHRGRAVGVGAAVRAFVLDQPIAPGAALRVGIVHDAAAVGLGDHVGHTVRVRLAGERVGRAGLHVVQAILHAALGSVAGEREQHRGEATDGEQGPQLTPKPRYSEAVTAARFSRFPRAKLATAGSLNGNTNGLLLYGKEHGALSVEGKPRRRRYAL